MRIYLVPDPASPYGQDAFCREITKRAPARGHTVQGSVQDADTVFINSFQPEPLKAAHAAGRKTAMRLIDSFAEQPAEAMVPIREILLQADLFLVPSLYLEQQLRAWGSRAAIRLVPYAYDHVRANEVAVITMRASRSTNFQIVATCSFTPSCLPGLETLLAALHNLRFDWHLTLIGDGPMRSELEGRLTRLMPKDRIFFAGDLPHLKIMDYFRAAKAYVCLSGTEGFPAMCLYALSEGCPVVGPRLGAVTELLTHGVNGLLYNAWDASSLSEALFTLWSVHGLSLEIISAGVKTVSGRTWEATMAATFAALEELA